MHSFLISTVILLGFVVVFGYFNEKVTRLTHEIALMLFAVIFGGVGIICSMIFHGAEPVLSVLSSMQFFQLEEFLMEGVLCFMLFAGSCHMQLFDFKKHARVISVLSVLATFLGAVFYGLLIFAVGRLLGLPASLPVCLMFGSIVAPTDPIAATSILKKFHLPAGISFIMEGESLFNDGMGVALFVFFSGMVTAESSGGFFFVMFKELVGAVLVGLLVMAVCFPVIRFSQDAARRIFASLLAVSLSYVLCEAFGFSGAIASVVCGISFSAMRSRMQEQGEMPELEQFDNFWEIIDTLLNSVLYVMLGLSFLHILGAPHVLLLSAVAILANLIGRSLSLGASVLLAGPLPDHYDRLSFVKLLTWGGLRGGLSVALAMSTQSLLSEQMYNIVLGGTYAIVFFTTIVQGMTMRQVYQRIEEKTNGLKQ